LVERDLDSGGIAADLKINGQGLVTVSIISPWVAIGKSWHGFGFGATSTWGRRHVDLGSGPARLVREAQARAERGAQDCLAQGGVSTTP
jgi:hypothetical protein